MCYRNLKSRYNRVSHQFQLLKSSRFAPFFWTQFLGAYNDNVYKNALILLITYQTFGLTTDKINILANVCAAAFTLPFFLFSTTAGQLADKYEKARLIRYIKFGEIPVTLCAAFALIWHNLYFLIFVLFLFGAQSAFFGPVKYSILPEQLKQQELMGGNGMVEMGTFVAILIGTLVGGLLMGNPNYGIFTTGLMVILVAISGWLLSLKIPATQAAAHHTKIKWAPFAQTWESLRYAYHNPSLFYVIIGISWFWSFGGLFLAQIANYVKVFLGGNAYIVTLLLTLFSIGIGSGSLLCERLSAQRIELGLVPLGIIGLVLFTLDFACSNTLPYTGPLMDFLPFILQWSHWHLILDIFFIGMFGGFYIVPLYALLQRRSPHEIRSRIIATNNIVNSFFMVATATGGGILLALGCTLPQLFLLTALSTFLIASLIFYKNLEFLIAFLAWNATTFYYRIVKSPTLEKLAMDDQKIVICSPLNTLQELLILIASLPRIPHFMVTPTTYQSWPFIFKALTTHVVNDSMEALTVLNRNQADLIHLTPDLLSSDAQRMLPIAKNIYTLTISPQTKKWRSTFLLTLTEKLTNQRDSKG